MFATSDGFPGPLVTAKHAVHTEPITDANGQRKAVVLPIEEYESLIEDLADLTIIAELI